MISLLNPLVPVVSLLFVLANIVNGSLPFSDADLKSLVCFIWILTRVHNSLDRDTQEQAKTWSRKALFIVCIILFLSIFPHLCVPLKLNTSLQAWHCTMPSHVISFSKEEQRVAPVHPAENIEKNIKNHYITNVLYT